MWYLKEVVCSNRASWHRPEPVYAQGLSSGRICEADGGLSESARLCPGKFPGGKISRQNCIRHLHRLLCRAWDFEHHNIFCLPRKDTVGIS